MNITWRELESYLFGELNLDQSQRENYKSRFNKIHTHFRGGVFNRQTIVAYKLHLQETYSASTVGLILGLLKHICTMLKVDYMKDIRSPKRGRVFKHILSKKEEKQLVDLAYSINYRAAVAVELTLRYGYRIGTIINLKWEDIHGDYIILKKQKDNDEKWKPLDKVMLHKINQLRRWKHGYVFGAHNGLISDKFLNVFLRDLLKRLNIQKYMTFHDLRHTFASLLHDEGVDIRFLQELLDHKRITTTELYTHVSIESQRKMLKKHPLAVEELTDHDVLEDLRQLTDKLYSANYSPIFFDGGSEFILKVPKKTNDKSSIIY